MMIQGIAHAAVTVRDMNESMDFYTRVLGFKKVFSIDDPEDGSPWIEYLMIGNGQFIELFYNGETPNPWNEKLLGFGHLCLQTDDVQKMAQYIRDQNYPIDQEPSMAVDNNWQVWVKDPNGMRIEIMQISENSPHAKAIREG